eukprot:371066-Pelagomonas_calceolata.AAC.2
MLGNRTQLDVYGPALCSNCTHLAPAVYVLPEQRALQGSWPHHSRAHRFTELATWQQRASQESWQCQRPPLRMHACMHACIVLNSCVCVSLMQAQSHGLPLATAPVLLRDLIP